MADIIMRRGKDGARGERGFTGRDGRGVPGAPGANGRGVDTLLVDVTAAPYNADPTGVADSTAAWNAAAMAAYARGANVKLFAPAGTYRISSTVTVRCALEAEQATLNYYGAGTALVLGVDTGENNPTFRQKFSCPRVVMMGRVSGWSVGSVGIKAVNLNTCELYVPFVQDFERGLVMYGNNGGNAHNVVYNPCLWDNQKNFVADCTPTGYSNQNMVIGGRFSQSVAKGAVMEDVNAAQIYMVSQNPEGGPNNNTFLGTSFEGDNHAYYRVDVAGSYNQFINCRWETPANVSPRIRYRSSAIHNHIQGGYGSGNIVEIFDGTLGGGSIKDAHGAYMAVNTTGPAQLIPTGVWTPITSWATPVSRRCAYNAVTGEFTPRPGRWMIHATVTFATNATGRRIASLSCAGSTVDICETPGNASRSSLKLAGTFRFNGQQTFTINANQTSGADLALEGSTPYVRVTAEYLGV